MKSPDVVALLLLLVQTIALLVIGVFVILIYVARASA